MARWFHDLFFWVALAIAIMVVLIGLDFRYIEANDPAEFKTIFRNPTLIAALVAGLLALITLLANQFAGMAHAEHQRKSEELKTMVGLAAEIRSNLERQRKSFPVPQRQKLLQDVLDRIADQRPTPRYVQRAKYAARPLDTGDTKVGFSDPDNFIYQSLKTSVLKLPPEVIGELVIYYNFDGMLNRAISEFALLNKAEPIRQLTYFCNLFLLTNETDLAGRAALRSLKQFVSVDHPEFAKAGVAFAVQEPWHGFPAEVNVGGSIAVRHGGNLLSIEQFALMTVRAQTTI